MDKSLGEFFSKPTKHAFNTQNFKKHAEKVFKLKITLEEDNFDTINGFRVDKTLQSLLRKHLSKV